MILSIRFLGKIAWNPPKIFFFSVIWYTICNVLLNYANKTFDISNK